MQTFARVCLILACCVAYAIPAEAQFRDPDSRSYSDSSRYRDRTSRRDRERVARRVETYVFGERGHIPSLAADLYEQANAVCWEMYRNYHHNHDYRVTYREMYQVRTAARHIQKLTRENYYRTRHRDDHIEHDLYEIDDWLHHVQRYVRDWEPDHRFGNLHVKMDRLEDTLHHLMKDYGIKSRIKQAVRRESRVGPYRR